MPEPLGNVSGHEYVHVSQDTAGDFDSSTTLAPNGYKPIFRVE